MSWLMLSAAVDRGGRLRMPDHADAEHEGVAEPEGEAGDEADLGDVDRREAPVRIDAEADGAAGEDRGADVVADGVAREARQCGDAIGHLRLADGAQREQVVERQRKERAQHAQRGCRDLALRFLRQRRQHDSGVDALQGAEQVHDRDGHDQQAGGDAQPLPADPLREERPSPLNSRCNSSSRQGATVIEADWGDSEQTAAAEVIRQFSCPENRPLARRQRRRPAGRAGAAAVTRASYRPWRWSPLIRIMSGSQGGGRAGRPSCRP